MCQPDDSPARGAGRFWTCLLFALPALWFLLVMLPPPLGLGWQHGNDFQAHRIWWFLLGTESLVHGHVPAWSPYRDYGWVFLGGTGLGSLYPFNWWMHPVFAARVPALQTAAMYATIILHMGWAQLGVFRLLRGLGVRSAAAAAAGACLVLVNQRFNDSIRYPNTIEAMAWIPWMVFWLHRLLNPPAPAEGIDRRAFAGVAASTAMSWLAGYGQLTYIGMLLCGVVCLAHLPGRSVRAWLPAPLALALGSLLSVANLLPAAMSALSSAQRAGGDAAFALTSPMNGGYLHMLAHPFSWDVHASSFFPPACAPFLLAGLVVALRAPGASRRMAAGLAAGALLVSDLARGDQGLCFRLFFHHVPFYSAFRIQGRNNWITAIPLAWFLGLGVQAALGWSRARQALLLAAAALAALAPLGFTGVSPAPANSALAMYELSAAVERKSILILAAGSLLAVAVLLVARQRRAAALAPALLVAAFVMGYARWTTFYKDPPITRALDHFEQGLLAPTRLGEGLMSNVMISYGFEPVWHRERTVAGPDPRRFPATRFVFVPGPEAHAAPDPAVTLRLDGMGPNHLRATVQSPVAGRLVWIQNWHPGWQANLPLGKAPEPFPAWVSVDVPAGTTPLALEFAWMPLDAAVLVTVAGLAGLLAWAASPPWRRRAAVGAGLCATVILSVWFAGTRARHSLDDHYLFGPKLESKDPDNRVPVYRPAPDQGSTLKR